GRQPLTGCGRARAARPPFTGFRTRVGGAHDWGHMDGIHRLAASAGGRAADLRLQLAQPPSPPGPAFMLKTLLSYQRYTIFAFIGLVLAALLAGAALYSRWLLVPGLAAGALFLLGIRDLRQRRHSILRNYPVVGHLRFLLESFRPEIRQYIIESDQDQVPFSREARGLVYQRAKGAEDKRPFGTIENVYGSGYAWLTHSATPVTIADADF